MSGVIEVRRSGTQSWYAAATEGPGGRVIAQTPRFPTQAQAREAARSLVGSRPAERNVTSGEIAELASELLRHPLMRDVVRQSRPAVETARPPWEQLAERATRGRDGDSSLARNQAAAATLKLVGESRRDAMEATAARTEAEREQIRQADWRPGGQMYELVVAPRLRH